MALGRHDIRVGGVRALVALVPRKHIRIANTPNSVYLDVEAPQAPSRIQVVEERCLASGILRRHSGFWLVPLRERWDTSAIGRGLGRKDTAWGIRTVPVSLRFPRRGGWSPVSIDLQETIPHRSKERLPGVRHRDMIRASSRMNHA